MADKYFGSEKQDRVLSIIIIVIVLIMLGISIYLEIYKKNPFSFIKLILTIIFFMFFCSRFASKIEFKDEYCYVYTPFFVKHRYDIKRIDLVVIFGMKILKFNESWFKFAYYFLQLRISDLEEIENLIQKIKKQQ